VQTGAYQFASALRESGLFGVGVALLLRNQREFTLAAREDEYQEW
jgi:acyl-CoA synthetase (AMP-forming)/AMP-acid ligase II